MKNKIYKISQNENTGYDTFDSAVVVAPDEETAKRINPREWASEPFMTEKDWNRSCSPWCSSPDKVKVKYLGEADDSLEIGAVCSSFNAG